MTIDPSVVERAVDRAAVQYDKDGDQHYDVISAFIKSMRGSDVNAALHYLARMIEAGEDPRFIARRIVILASEDVGLADPAALGVAVAAAPPLELVGLPEAGLNLAQATIYLSLAPKSNAVITALGAATADVRSGLAGAVPPALRDAHYPGARRLQHGKGYRYPHAFPDGVVEQQYAPDVVHGRDYYEPSGHGREAGIIDRLAWLRSVLRGEPAAGPDILPARDDC
jgi:putative ATPase